jgi:hypothetical protein
VPHGRTHVATVPGRLNRTIGSKWESFPRICRGCKEKDLKKKEKKNQQDKWLFSVLFSFKKTLLTQLYKCSVPEILPGLTVFGEFTGNPGKIEVFINNKLFNKI